MISRAIHIHNGGTSVVLDVGGADLPVIVYWGPELVPASNRLIDSLVRASKPQAVSGGLCRTPRLSLLPLESQGWQGTPGLILLSAKTGYFSPKLSVLDVKTTTSSIFVAAVDAAAHVSIELVVEVLQSGLLSQHVTVKNNARDKSSGNVDIHDIALSFPLPISARELLNSNGRHLRERHPHRHAFTIGKHVQESRRGRPGLGATLLVAAGEPQFGFETGLVHGVHLAWSGNYRINAEKGSEYGQFIQAGEILLPGEVSLSPGESYRSPTALGSWGKGLSQMSYRYHDFLRRRSPSSPQPHPVLPRPVTINTWEAVYFDMDMNRLKAIADAAAAVGAERFVLDDGWFKGRRSDNAGLGDWTVDRSVFPEGLQPLWDHVQGLGMECGIWVELEMVNLDSDLARAHPEWLLRPSSQRLPMEARQQYVLDLSNKKAFECILGQMHALLREYPMIKYFKWDHNRDLIESGGLDGKPAVRKNVEAVYALIDSLKQAHPGLEIESCASGGGRVDLGILQHDDRIWVSDCTDPVERLTIQKYTSLIVPPEMMGQHVGAPKSHTTGRTHELCLRAGAALFGHMGIEWDISRVGVSQLEDLRWWIGLHKKWRDIIHTGQIVFADLPSSTPSQDVRGVVSADKRKALYTYTQITTAESYPAPMITFPGLDEESVYCLKLLSQPGLDDGAFVGQSNLVWLHSQTPCIMSGQMLGHIGIQMPVVWPETLLVIEVEMV